MYDDRTRELIGQVARGTALGDFDLAELLTEAHTTLATLRLRLNDRGEEDGRLHEIAVDLRRIAVVLGVQACLLDDSEQRRAAAFVAATAHRLLFAYAGATRRLTRSRNALDAGHVSSDLCAALLFLAAGYPADAAAAVANTLEGGDFGRRRPLVSSLVDLARGQLGGIVGRDVDLAGLDVSEALAELTLWRNLLRAVADVERIILGAEDAPAWSVIAERLRRVASLAVSDLPSETLPPSGSHVVSIFAGPHHLATLLLAAVRGLEEGALASAPAPIGPAPEDWNDFVAQRVRSRPFLWTNHREAMNQGLLNNGRSAVITFPTGAGKSTLAELKIASNLLQGRRVVYLVPTLALVGQVTEAAKQIAKDCRSREGDAVIFGSVHGDGLFADLTEERESQVIVATPERCLLMLGLAPELFEDLGLLVFDEVHLTHMASASIEDGRRAVDAMLCLLKILDSAPGADVLLMSAMVGNADELATWLSDSFGKDATAFDAAWKPTRQVRAGVVYEAKEVEKVRQLQEGRILVGKKLDHKAARVKPHLLASLRQTWHPSREDDLRLFNLLDSSVPLKVERMNKNSRRVSVSSMNTECGVELALAAAAIGLKTIVFLHKKDSVNKAAGLARARVQMEVVPTPGESELLQAIAQELGGIEYAIRPVGGVGAHHADLLPFERELVEATFRVPEGIKILFATSTLSQGMNLPADQVVIVGTDTYDARTGQQRRIDAHDLLNAAGRAGRAGYATDGLVLVVPGRLATLSWQTEYAMPSPTRQRARYSRKTTVASSCGIRLRDCWTRSPSHRPSSATPSSFGYHRNRKAMRMSKQDRCSPVPSQGDVPNWRVHIGSPSFNARLSRRLREGGSCLLKAEMCVSELFAQRPVSIR